MLLRSTPFSPFGRKVKMAAKRLKFYDKMTIVASDAMDPKDELRKDNPLGKMPCLVLDDGRRIYDSRVILEYLDHAAGGGKIIPNDWPRRIDCLRLQALCDGITDAAILIVYEDRYRPKELAHAPWLDYQRDKITRGLDALEKELPDPADFTVGPIALSTALGYLDFRKQVDYRTRNPSLAKWLDAFRAKNPEFDATHAVA